MKSKKADLPFWLVGLILTVILILILLFIVLQSGSFQNSFIDWLRDAF